MTNHTTPNTFTGLTAADFTGHSTGTHWRARTSLGGLLADGLSAVAGRPFISQAVDGHPLVYLVEPHRDASTKRLYFRTAPSGADFGLTIEKGNQPKDGRGEWPHFLAALRDPAHTARLERAMAFGGDGALGLTITLERHEGGRGGPIRESGLYLGEQLTRFDVRSDEATTWPDLADQLAATDAADWLNVRLHGSLSQAAAIALGAAITPPALAVYEALLPLYDACG